MFQASELAEFTSKISLLEEAKKKKDEEATEWQQKVQDRPLCTSALKLQCGIIVTADPSPVAWRALSQQCDYTLLDCNICDWLVCSLSISRLWECQHGGD